MSEEANATSKVRLVSRGAQIAELGASKQLALSRIVAQHLEIQRLPQRAR